MKKEAKKFSCGLNILILSCLIFCSCLSMSSILALQEKTNNQIDLDYLDRSTWKWTNTMVVTTESTSHSMEPSLAMDSEGRIHVVWMDLTNLGGAGADWDILYKSYISDSGWSTTEVVSTESIADSFFPSIAADSLGNIHVAWYDNTDYAGSGTDWDIFYKRWNSSSWTTTEVVSTESTGTSENPSIAVDSLGNIHITWADTTNYNGAGTDWDIFYKRWNSSTTAWTTSEVVSTESTLDSRHPSIAVDSTSNAHITWDDTTNYNGAGTDWDIFYKRWNSSSWTTLEVVSTESTLSSVEPCLAADSEGRVHVAWYDQTDFLSAGTDSDIFYKRMEFDREWSITKVISTESIDSSLRPSIVVDSANDVHFTWDDHTYYKGTDWDIFYKRLDSSTSSLTTTYVVSTESTGHSIHPSIAVDSANYIAVTWIDFTDYNGAGTDYDIFARKFSGSPNSPELAFIIPNPTESNLVSLHWKHVPGANSYYIYRSSSYIWSLDGLYPIASVFANNYLDSLSSEGFYYYVIVAWNTNGNSSHSNCQYVEYSLPHVREFTLISSLIIGVFVISLVILKNRKNKLK